MALANYTDLQAAIGNFLARADLGTSGANAARVPEIVTLAEARLNADLRITTMATTTTVAMTPGSVATVWDVATKVIRSAKIVTSTPPHELVYVAPENLVNFQKSGSGEPEYYTIRDAIEWNQTPDAAYSVVIEYFPRLNIASTTTNWLFTALPNVYLYACLLEATSGLLQDDVAAQKFGILYADFLPRAKRLLASVGGAQNAQASFDVPDFGGGSYNVRTDE